MRLQLRKLRYKNFLAVGNYWIEILLDDTKTTLMVGKNGSGKSTMLDALSYVLFNKPFRKINKPQIVNTITNKDCLVEVEFTLNSFNFRVLRGAKPAVFEIWKDGELLTQTADNRDYQEALEKYILKISHKTFCQIVVLGSAIFTPFMSLPALQRRDVIEDLLDLEIFTKMNKLLKDRLDNCDIAIYEKENEKKLVDERIRLTQEHHQRINQSFEEIKKAKWVKLQELDQEIAKIVEAVEKLDNTINELTLELLDPLYHTRDELNGIKSMLRMRSQTVNKELLFFQNNEVCPTCHQDIDADFKTRAIDERYRTAIEVNEGLEKLQVRLQNFNERIAQVEKTHKEKQELENDKRTKTKIEQHFVKQREGVCKELAALDAEIRVDFDFTVLQEMRNELELIEKTLVEMGDDRTVMGYAAVLLKDSGIKGKIIKTFIPVINQLLQKYLAAFDFFVDFRLDETFNETILSRHRDNFSYESFSEGEKMRLNLAILFTWRAIARLRSLIDCNLIVMDEILDSALDNEGIEDMLRVISTLTGNDNVFIISHREDQISDKFNRVVRYEKVNSFTKVIE